MSHIPTPSSEPDNLINDLTEPQCRAVTHVNGPLLVLAGAGSGKTRVITRRVAHMLLRAGIPPWNILAITFTNKAANEMRRRVAQLVSMRQGQSLSINTFHSFCAQVLRRYADRLNLLPQYSIYDTSDQIRAVKQVLKELDMSTANFQPAAVLNTISHAKNELIDEEAYAASASDYYSRQIAKIYRGYQRILRRNQALDFDDLLAQTVRLVREHDDVRSQLQDRFQYVLIDEYQDTNHAQFVLAHVLASGHRNLCVTGDPDQSIYSWRGADIRNILDFEKHYPDAKVIRLEQNYRSTKLILAAADGMIQHNTYRKHKSLWTENETGQPVQIVTYNDEQDEAQSVVKRFQQLREKHNFAWSDFAVFYRVNAMSRVIEEALLQAGMPYQIARGTAFYDRKEIKDTVAYLRVIANPTDEVNLLRIINTPPRGISPKTVKAMQAHAVATGTSLADVMADPTQLRSVGNRAAAAIATFDRTLHRWRALAGLHNDTKPPVDTELVSSLRSLIENVLDESGLERYCRSDKSDPEHERLANLGELVSAALQFEIEYEETEEDDHTWVSSSKHRPPNNRSVVDQKLHGFLERVSLVGDVDAVRDDQGAVTLMTLHAAKGLEFPAVAIVAVEEGLLPHTQSQDEQRQLEEERRLCFVGITRAQRHLLLTHVRFRTIFGRTEPRIPSRFLQELPDESLERIDNSKGHDTFISAAQGRHSLIQRQQAATVVPGFPPGSLVNHPQFGVGRIIQVTASGAHTRARIDFEDVGVKTLILQYAHLEQVE